MKTVAANLTTLKFVTDASAAGCVVLKSREDLEKLETKQLLGLYNNSRDVQIKKFDTRAVAIDRVVKLIDTVAPELKMAVDQETPKVKTEQAASTPKVKASVQDSAPQIDAVTKAKRIRTEEAAVDRIIKYGKDHAVFSLEDAEVELGIKKTCMRTHMSFINSNGVRFGEVKFIGNRKDKTYTMKVPTRPVPSSKT